MKFRNHFLISFLNLCIFWNGVQADHNHRETEGAISKFFNFKPLFKQTAFTFMVSGRNFGEDMPVDINPQLSLFYKTLESDRNNQTSEVIQHSANPNWMTVFKANFDSRDAEDKEYHFKVKDVDGKGHGSLLGEAKIAVQKLWDTVSRDGEATLPLTSGNGHLVVTKTEPITFKLSASNLAKRDTFGGKSDPYVKCLWSRGPDGPEVEFFRTSWIGNVVDAEWMEVIVFDGYQKGTDQYLHFKVYDDDGITSDDFLGEAFLKLDDHLKPKMDRRRVVSLMNEPKKKGGKGALVVTIIGDPAGHPDPADPDIKELMSKESKDWFYN